MNESITQLFSQYLQSDSFTLIVVLLAFIGGVISSLSPCTLGLLPVIVGYVCGYGTENNKKTATQAFFFIVGLSLVLTVFGVIASATGKAFGSHYSEIWGLLMASLILLMGLSLLEIIQIPMPSIVRQIPQNKGNNLVLYPILIGGAFALASSPCSTPILAGIIAFASLKANIMLGAVLLFVFSLGQGMILVFAALFSSVMKKMLNMRSYAHYLTKTCGVILVIAAVLIYANLF